MYLLLQKTEGDFWIINKTSFLFVSYYRTHSINLLFETPTVWSRKDMVISYTLRSHLEMYMLTWLYRFAWNESRFNRTEIKIHIFLPCYHWCILSEKSAGLGGSLFVWLFIFNLHVRLIYVLFMILKKTPILYLQNRPMYRSKI